MGLPSTKPSAEPRVLQGQLQIAQTLFRFVNDELIPGSGISAEDFWSTTEAILRDLAPRNRKLLEKRNTLQARIDDWHRSNSDGFDPAEYKTFLQQIGYLLPEVEDFRITVAEVDEEIAAIAGPQLVVPVNNARYAINAANARWGSLYDALYGTDIIRKEGSSPPGSYDPERGAQVIAWGRRFLDEHVGLTQGSHAEVSAYTVVDKQLVVRLMDSTEVTLTDPRQFVGYRGSQDAPQSVLLRHNGLHIEIQIDPEHFIGRDDRAHVKDLVLESALTTIQDFEDSVAAVDADDKVLVYRNWLKLMQGTLRTTLNKNGKDITRTLNPPRLFSSSDGGELRLPGCSLLLARNVGLLMTTDAVLGPDGSEVPEHILDALMTVVAALHAPLYDDAGNAPNSTTHLPNSRHGSIYIVKPKMHGPDEVAFCCELFSRIEQAFGLRRNRLKIGIMDEERRTTVNLKACISAARERVIFINTGFLDRTGDEIHTSMEAGAFVRKGEMKSQPWLAAYEDRNVDIGLATGFSGQAQIGKGMWAMPDEMAAMMQDKVGHPRAGANCAWVPSPTAATLHALHYHEVDVSRVQQDLRGRREAALDEVLKIPLAPDSGWDATAIQEELDNNAQGLLGYVVRWINHGVGCSKVADINNVGLMEDRATLRISSQHIANWLRHGVCSKAQVKTTLERMALLVDRQNADDPDYVPMGPEVQNSIAFQAACDLVFDGCHQPNGYTEPALHARRRQFKAEHGNRQ